MSRDAWLTQLRQAGNDASTVARLLANAAPGDGLQHGGQAVLRSMPSDELVPIATALIEALSRRGWPGDPELIAELEHVRNGTNPELALLPVDLNDLSEALDQSLASVSYIDLTNAMVWPGELFDVDQGPDDFDADDSHRWIPVVGAGSNVAYTVIERFIATIDNPGLAARLLDTIKGSGAFRRFQTELSRHDNEYTRWHRFHDDARLGHARAWLANHGYRSMH